MIDEIPILPAIGNHEQDGINYLNYVHLPGKELWYAYDAGPVHVLSLDFRSEKETDEQFAFARRDLLSATAPWKVVFLHYPVFNIGGHGTGWGHATYLPLFHQAKVDLVLAGHSHIYERFRPIANVTGPDTWPITHITTGGGGAPLYTVYSHPALETQASTNHFVLIEATPTRLSGRALTTNETVIDTFELKKSNGRPAAEYVARVYSEETLKLSFAAAPSLTGDLNLVPGAHSPARVMFSIRPLKTAKQSAELEISLTSDSAPYYKLEGGRLRVRTPSATESNKVVWANVRATGQKRVEALVPSGTLSPALTFQARIITGKIETVAYGQRCRVSVTAAQEAKKPAETQSPR